MITTVRVVAILFAGLMTGLLFGDWLGPSFARSEMPLSGFVQFQQIIHYKYLKALPGVSLVALLSPIVWAILARRPSFEFRILVLAIVAIAAGSAITFIYNVPINDVLETWNYNSPPSNARELWQPWETAHVVRTVFWGVGFVLEIFALAITARGDHSSSADLTALRPSTG